MHLRAITLHIPSSKFKPRCLKPCEEGNRSGGGSLDLGLRAEDCSDIIVTFVFRQPLADKQSLPGQAAN